ncbi:DUF1700 domain-containing protein [Cerasibacillus terrae]|nr:DUF1700 domain-containing protein [Cerasibacillus terrae]
MNKDLFLKQLQLELRGLDPNEIEEIIQDYDDYFIETKENGFSEEATIKQLGNPHEIAQNIQNNYHHSSSNETTTNSLRNVIVGFALIFFNLIFVLGPALGIFGALIGITFALGVSVISPVITLLKMILGTGHWFEFFFSLILSGIGILLLPLLLQFIQNLPTLIKRYIDWNVRVGRGETR